VVENGAFKPAIAMSGDSFVGVYAHVHNYPHYSTEVTYLASGTSPNIKYTETTPFDNDIALHPESMTQIILYPCESVINPGAVQGINFVKGEGKVDILPEPGIIPGGTSQQTYPTYMYSSAFTTYPPALYITSALNYDHRTELPSTIMTTLTKLEDSHMDVWLYADPMDQLLLGTKDGSITGLVNFDNHLYSWQRSCFSNIQTEFQALQGVDNSTPLILGTGGILQRY